MELCPLGIRPRGIVEEIDAPTYCAGTHRHSIAGPARRQLVAGAVARGCQRGVSFRLNAGLGAELAAGDGIGQSLIVEVVLVGVRRGEACDRLLEVGALSEVPGDRKPVS
jgi:hypothetical protein